MFMIKFQIIKGLPAVLIWYSHGE